jgi:hypothetical protein
MPRASERARQVWVPRMYAFLREQGGEALQSRVIEEGMRYVPGGAAYREGLAKRLTDSRYRNFGVEGQLTKQDSLSLVRAGQNRIVTKSLYYERKSERLERFIGPDGQPWLRLKSEPKTDD